MFPKECKNWVQIMSQWSQGVESCRVTRQQWICLQQKGFLRDTARPSVPLRPQQRYLIVGGCRHADCKTTTANRWNDSGRRVAAEYETTRRAVLLHRTSQRVLSVFRQSIHFRQQHHCTPATATQCTFLLRYKLNISQLGFKAMRT